MAFVISVDVLCCTAPPNPHGNEYLRRIRTVVDTDSIYKCLYKTDILSSEEMIKLLRNWVRNEPAIYAWQAFVEPDELILLTYSSQSYF